MTVAPEVQLPLAGRLPADTLAYVGWAGRDLVFDGSAFGQFLNLPAVGRFLDLLQSGSFPDSPSLTSRAFWSLLAIAWQRPMALAAVPGRSQDGNSVRLLVVVDLGRDREQFARHLEQMLTELGLEDKLAQDPAVAISGYRRFVDHKQLEYLGFGFVDDLFIVSTSAELSVKFAGLKADESLQNQPDFCRHMSMVVNPNLQLAYYANLTALREIALVGWEADSSAGDQTIQRTSKETAEFFGLDKAEALVGSVCIVDRGMYRRLRLVSRAPHRGLLVPLAGPALVEGDLDAIPKDADLAVAFRLSPQVAYSEFRRMLGYFRPVAQAGLDDWLRRMEEQTGLSLTADLLSPLDDLWTLSSSASQGGVLTGTVLRIRVSDSARLAESLEKLASFLQQELPPGMLGTVTYRNIKTWYLNCPDIGISLLPSWAQAGEWLCISFWPQVSASAGMTPGGLAGDQQFRSMWARVSSHASVLAYLNVPQIISHVYPLLLFSLANEAGGQSIPYAELLPTLLELQEFLWPQIAAFSSDEEGITFEGYGSLPLCPVDSAIIFPTIRAWQSVLKQAAKTNTPSPNGP